VTSLPRSSFCAARLLGGGLTDQSRRSARSYIIHSTDHSCEYSCRLSVLHGHFERAATSTTMKMICVLVVLLQSVYGRLVSLFLFISGGAYEARRIVPPQNLGPGDTLWGVPPQNFCCQMLLYPCYNQNCRTRCFLLDWKQNRFRPIDFGRGFAPDPTWLAYTVSRHLSSCPCPNKVDVLYVRLTELHTAHQNLPHLFAPSV